MPRNLVLDESDFERSENANWTELNGRTTREFDLDKIIGKVLDLFRLRGYKATSVDDLVIHLGIRRSSLYNAFGSKHALYLAALERYLAQGQSGAGRNTMGTWRGRLSKISWRRKAWK